MGSRPPSPPRARHRRSVALLDTFVTREPGRYAKYNLFDTCADGYFLKQWLDEEDRKYEIAMAVRSSTSLDYRNNH